jgi:hypothetical protein
VIKVKEQGNEKRKRKRERVNGKKTITKTK